MKKLAVLLLAPVLLGETLSPSDRDFLAAQLERTRDVFVKSITGISQAQWSFKPAGGGWSIAECAEHIVLSEDALFGLSGQILKSPTMKDAPPRTREQDEKIVAALADRSKKAQAPEQLKPTGGFPTPAVAIEKFNEKRARSLQYVRTTQDDLRAHVSPSQLFGTMDAYQYLVMMAAHSGRHTAQLNEVKTSAGYPAK